MTTPQTALFPSVTERTKARVRFPLLLLLTSITPPLVGMRSGAVWILYIVFGLLYSLWALRLTQVFSADRRLGWVLAVIDAALLLPLAAWSTGAGIKLVVAVISAAGFAVTYWAGAQRRWLAGRLKPYDLAPSACSGASQSGSQAGHAGSRLEMGLEGAVKLRLRLLQETGARFGIVILRIAHFAELRTCYGDEAADRLLVVLGRRGIRLLGPEAQRFLLPGGRVAFLFDTEVVAKATGEETLGWRDTFDVEGLAMILGRKLCERLIDGHKVECVVGWASAPADGLMASDLISAAEAGACSTALFRRVGGAQVSARVVPTAGPRTSSPMRAASERARTAAG